MALLLSRADVESILDMPTTIAAVEDAFRELARGTVDMPQRPVIRVAEHGGTVLFMPAYIGGTASLGMKLVSVYPQNPTQHNLPTTMGVILVCEAATGQVVSVMDGGFITAMRTGAVTGVAARVMARPEATVLGLFGAGVQARTQLLAVAAVRPLSRVIVCDVAADQAQRFAAEMAERLDLAIEVASEPRQAVEGADIVVTATSAASPVFDGRWLREGTHISGIGSHAAHMRELDTVTVQRSRVIVDSRRAALAEAGDLILPIQEGAIAPEHIVGELGEVLLGQVAGRTSPAEITLFKSVGLAIQDVAVAARVYAAARERGIGQEMRF